MNHLHQLLGFLPVLVENFERNLFTKKKKKVWHSTWPLKNVYFTLWPTLWKGISWVWGKSRCTFSPNNQLFVPYIITEMANVQRWQSHRRLSVTAVAAPCCCDSNLSTPKADINTNSSLTGRGLFSETWQGIAHFYMVLIIAFLFLIP